MITRVCREEHTCQKCGRAIKKGETVIFEKPRGLAGFYRCSDCGLYVEEIYEMQASKWQRNENHGHSWRKPKKNGQ